MTVEAADAAAEGQAPKSQVLSFDPDLDLEVDLQELVLGAVLGQGSFKNVVACTFRRKSLAYVSFRDPAQLRSARKELDVMGRMHHANTVQIYALVNRGSAACGWLTDRCACDLRTWLRNDQDGHVQTRMRFLRDVATALEYLHGAFSLPFVHRDVKTPNVLISRGKPLMAKLGDFGLARSQADMDQGTVTSMAGTPNFMAPEQWEGKKITPKSDVYGFGGVIAEVFTNKEPWNGLKGMEVFKAQQKSGDVRCPELNLFKNDDDYDEAFRLAWYTHAWNCLSKEPAKRPSAHKCRKFWEEQAEGKAENEIFLEDKIYLQSFLDSVRLLLGEERLRVFISYAWFANDDPRLGPLQLKLNQLKEHLKILGADVFLDYTGDMVGNVNEKMATNLQAADFALVVGTSRMKSRAEAPEKNNIQFEHEEIARQCAKKPGFAIQLLAEGEAQEAFPACLTTKYPHVHSHADGTCVMLAPDSVIDLRSDMAYCAGVADLTLRLFPWLGTDPRYGLLRQVLATRLCHHKPLLAPNADYAALRSLERHVSLEERKFRPRCCVLGPETFNQGQEEVMVRVSQVRSFLAGAGVEVVMSSALDRAGPDGFGQRPTDKLIVLGLGRPINCLKFAQQHLSMVVPLMLTGTMATAFPGIKVNSLLILDFKWPWSAAACRDLLANLYGWDGDNQVWFARAIELYKLRKEKNFASCAQCIPKLVANLVVVGPKPAQVNDEVKDEDKREREWIEFRVKIPGLEDVSLSDLRSGPEKMVQEFANTLPIGLKFKLFGFYKN